MRSLTVSARSPCSFFVGVVKHEVAVFLHLELVRAFSLSISARCPGWSIVTVIDHEVSITLYLADEGTFSFATRVRGPDGSHVFGVFVQDEVAISLHSGFESLARGPDGLLVGESFLVLFLQALSVDALLQSEKELVS